MSQEGSKQRLDDLKKALNTKIDTIKAYPSEVRASGIWQASSELILKQGSIGLVAGLALGVVLFSTSSFVLLLLLLLSWRWWRSIAPGGGGVPRFGEWCGGDRASWVRSALPTSRRLASPYPGPHDDYPHVYPIPAHAP
jgi:hypothetical protein